MSAFTPRSHPALCSNVRPFVVQAAAGVSVGVGAAFFFFNLPRLATSEKQILLGNIWRCPEREPRRRGDILRKALEPFGFH